MTHHGALRADPKVNEAKKLLLEAVAAHSKSLTGIRPPKPELAAHYKEALDRLEKQRGVKLWYPFLGSGIGKGSLVELMDGSVKYDFIGGIGVHHFGHSHPGILSACIDGAICDVVMQGNLQQNVDQLELIDLLVKESKFPHCFLTTSGAMANENALKIAMQKHYPAKRILAFERGFAGRSIAMSQATEKPDVRDGLPVQLNVDFVPFYDPGEPEKSIKNAVDVLKRHLWRYPKDYAIFIAELIQGEGGYYEGSREYYRSIFEIAKNNKVAIHMDEIQTFGRTSKLFAFQHYDLEDLADIVTIGKLAQTCATFFTEEYTPKAGLLSQTFTSSTSAIHASKEIIHLMIREGFFGPEGKNMKLNKLFTEKFEEIRRKHPRLMQGPYGVGAMIAFTPLDGAMQRVIKFGQNLFDAGVISFICGREPTRIRFLPPVGALSLEDIENVFKIIETTLKSS